MNDLSIFLASLPGIVAVLGVIYVVWKGGRLAGYYERRIEENGTRFNTLPCVRNPDYQHDSGARDTLVRLQAEEIARLNNKLGVLDTAVGRLEVSVGQLETLVAELKKRNGGKQS